MERQQPKAKKKQDSGWSDIKGGQAFVVPVMMLTHANFKRLSPWACKLVFDLGRQFNPKANGYLHAGINLMAPLGWRSAHTLQSARDELVHYGIIVKTVQGGKNRPSYYGFTFRKITERPDKPFDHRLPVAQPIDTWLNAAEEFTPQKSQRKNKSLVQPEHKVCAASAQVRSEFVQPEHKQTPACAASA